MKRFAIIIILLAFAFQISSIFADEKTIINAAKEEMNRFITELKAEPVHPYFIAYEIVENEKVSLNSSFGEIITNNESKSRTLNIDLRVGDYNFDNTHIIRGEAFNFYFRTGAIELPLGNDEEALRNTIWFETDKKYRDAIQKYEKVLTNSKVKVKEEDTSADFSHEKSNVYFGEKFNYTYSKAKWEKTIKNVSAIFANYDWLYSGYVSFSINNNKKYFLNSEGSEIYQEEPYSRVFISIKTKAEDGMSLPLYKSYFAFNPSELPDEQELIKDAMQLIETLDKLRNAPLMSTYSGPALLSGEASGVFFHEIFGHRVEGHRLKDPNNAQTYKNSINEEVLPEFINVVFDPTQNELGNKKLSGFYKFDNEGVKAEKVDVVKNGIFKNFLMSRSPIEGFKQSNGHGRRQTGYDIASRQSNLIVQSEETVSTEELKEQLRDLCKEEDKDFGLYFVKVQGGFTFTGRTIPNSFNVNPLLVYKIYADGRPDEMVRGVDLIGTPLTTFSNIVAAADDIGVFNGICGAESGGVPVSAVSPTLLVSKIEVQKKTKSQAKLPILPAPGEKNQ